MLSKLQRASRNDLSLLKQPSIYGSNDLFSLRAIKKDLPNSKISFSVSKKVSKSAVVRNKLRRLGYRAVNDLIQEIKNHIIVFSFRIIPKDFIEVEKSIKSLLIRSKIINNK